MPINELKCAPRRKENNRDELEFNGVVIISKRIRNVFFRYK